MLFGANVLSDNLIKNLNEGLIKSWLESVLPSVFSFVWCVILALFTYWLGRKVINFIRKCLRRAANHSSLDEGLKQFLDALVKIGLYIVLFLLILNLFGITTSSIAAAVAALGVTAGLSLQGALSNFAGGVLILTLHPFRVGDYIIEDSHGNEGTVSEISIIYTTLLTFDGKKVLIPNGMLANSSLTNCSSVNKRMVNLTVGISYDSDIKKAKDILHDIAQKEECRLKDEPVQVFVSNLGESSVDLGLRYWVDPANFWSAKWRSLETIKLRFDEAGISIPFNQLDVHLDK